MLLMTLTGTFYTADIKTWFEQVKVKTAMTTKHCIHKPAKRIKQHKHYYFMNITPFSHLLGRKFKGVLCCQRHLLVLSI